jgi:hypothetical protein
LFWEDFSLIWWAKKTCANAWKAITYIHTYHIGFVLTPKLVISWDFFAFNNPLKRHKQNTSNKVATRALLACVGFSILDE